jgi:hypothetical protein
LTLIEVTVPLVAKVALAVLALSRVPSAVAVRVTVPCWTVTVRSAAVAAVAPSSVPENVSYTV